MSISIHRVVSAGTQQILNIENYDQIFLLKSKKNFSWPISRNFGVKKVFPRNWTVMYNFIKISSTKAKFREISWSNSQKTPWLMSGRKDGQTLFHRILPATTSQLTSTIAVDWHLIVKDKRSNVAKTKKYCITVSMQKINSIHKLIHPILGSHELNNQAHF